MGIEEKIEHVRQAFKRFQDEVGQHGFQYYLYVHDPSELNRFWFCDFAHASESSAFHYLKKSVNAAQLFFAEQERWKFVIVGSQSPFTVVCRDNVEIEEFLEMNKVYIVVSALYGSDGYGFIITDENGMYVSPPPGFTSFHSSRFELSPTVSRNN